MFEQLLTCELVTQKKYYLSWQLSYPVVMVFVFTLTILNEIMSQNIDLVIVQVKVSTPWMSVEKQKIFNYGVCYMFLVPSVFI